MCSVKQCLLVVLYLVQIYHSVSSNQETCDKHDKPLNKTSDTEETKKPNLQSRYNPYLEEEEERSRKNLLRNFNFDYFDPNRIKSKDDFLEMDSDEIGLPMVRPRKPLWQVENTPYGGGPQVLPDVVVTPEKPTRRKLIPEVLGDDEKQLGRFLVEDTRRVIHMMHPNDENKNYPPLSQSPGYSYRHPAYPYGAPSSYSYQPRPRPYGYVNSQRNYINKEFRYPAYQLGPQLSPSFTDRPIYPPQIPHPMVPHLPMYKAPPIHHLVPTAPSSDEISVENDEKSAIANDQKNAMEQNTKVDSPYRVQLDLAQVKPQSNYNNHEMIHPGLQIPIPIPHPALHPMNNNDPKDVVEGDRKTEFYINVDKDPERSGDPTSEILKQLEDLLMQPDTSLLGSEAGNLKPEKSDAPTDETLKQLGDLLEQEDPQQNISLVGGETGNSKPEKSDDPTSGILKQLEDLLVESGTGNFSNPPGNFEGSLNDDVLKEIKPEEDISQTPNVNAVPEKIPEKDYTEIISAIMETDDIQDLVNNPIITADALKEIAQLLNIQQGNQDSIDSLLANEQYNTQPKIEESPHSKTSSLDSMNDNYIDVLSAIIETDRVEDLVNNPNIGSDVLKEIAKILEAEQESLVTEGNPMKLDQLENVAVLPREIDQIHQVGQENGLGLFPIGIETENGEVLPMSTLNTSLPLGSNGRANSGCNKTLKSPKRRSKTLRREDEGKELYFLGSENKIIRIPENLLEKPLRPLLSTLIAKENILATNLLNGTLERILDPTTKTM